MFLYILLAVVFFVIFIIYRMTVVPKKLIEFYRSQGLDAQFVPGTGALNLIQQIFDKHGDSFYLSKQRARENPNYKGRAMNIANLVNVNLCDVNLIKEFSFKDDCYAKVEAAFAKHLTKTGGLIGLKGDEWKRHRKIISSAFHFEFIKSEIPFIVSKVQSKFANIQKTQKDLKAVTILPIMSNLAGELVGDIFFGDNFTNYQIDGQTIPSVLSNIIADNSKITISPAYLLLGGGFVNLGLLKAHKDAIENMKKFRAVCANIVQDKKKNLSSNSHGLINKLIEAQKNSSEGLIDDDIVDEFIAFFIAGMESTSYTSQILFYILATKPDVRAKVQAEINQFYNNSAPPSLDDINKMNYLTGVIKETFRCYTPFPGTVPRIASVDHTLGDIQIKKGTSVRVDNFFNSFNPKYFENPDEFKPERWAQADKIDTYAFIPFWSGPRNCIGQHLSQIELKIMVCEFLKMYSNLKMKDGYEFKMISRGVYQPFSPVELNLE